jgi:hypothetical protein
VTKVATRKQDEHQTHLQRDYQRIMQAQQENMYVIGERIGILEAHAPHSIIFPLGVPCTETITDQGRVAWNGDVKMRSFHRPAQASLLTRMLKRCCRRRTMLFARRYSIAVQKERLQPEIAACSVCMRQSGDGMSLQIEAYQGLQWRMSGSFWMRQCLQHLWHHPSHPPPWALRIGATPVITLFSACAAVRASFPP